MFGKEKPGKENHVTAPINKTSSKDITTLIGEGCKVEGNFFVPTTTRIDGIIQGDLTGEVGIIIGNKALIEGNICASEVIVYGNVTGNVEADRLELKRGSNITGDITANNLITEIGANFNGKCSMKNAENSDTGLNE